MTFDCDGCGEQRETGPLQPVVVMADGTQLRFCDPMCLLHNVSVIDRAPGLVSRLTMNA